MVTPWSPTVSNARRLWLGQGEMSLLSPGLGGKAVERLPSSL